MSALAALSWSISDRKRASSAALAGSAIGTDGGCGDGEEGSKPGDARHDRDAVVAQRREELERSCRALGVTHLEMLGYRDSGMMGWSDNDAPGSFWTTPVEEAAAGLPIHGEAAAAHWNVTMPMDMEEIARQWNVHLPVAQLMFARKIRLGDHESVAYVEESVSNERNIDHPCHWVQHATFSPPFLNISESTLTVSALRGMTSPSDYEDCSLLAHNREFSWPNAPTQETPTSTAMADLRQPFAAKGLGFLAGVQLDPRRKVEYMLAVNWKLRLGVGYCFRQDDFPWMAIWEENCARQDNPWNGKVQARGMEFGTTPFPLGREETFRRGRLFDTPCWCVVPANGTKTARYLIFLFTVPDGMNSIGNVEAKGDALVLYDEHANPTLSIPSHECEEFLSTEVHNSF